MRKDVLEFIHRRFPNDSNWLTGNCYFFANILKSRFPEGVIYYDVVVGHFVTEIDGIKYDWSGVVEDDSASYYVEWDKFDEYDPKQKQRIINDSVF